ncbi:hypothetical protein [Ammoniphilus resinae]|uniref:Uncharacterized protein n=1 Tax=Ammoniphilus resinae TaxID=861532 RepID=A0ABS4GPR1_9BACL|nr:hypothetical protein [Ammoniphilus resinae]MBP1932258.1 hypothetical protein [Ammoniphilus resinae]
MNRSRYIPFERNRYFYGKLLTVRDFMSEQTYFTDKGRLLNRLLFGSGVISGLQVVAVDDKSVSVETGAALDQMGREIVVPSPVTWKLSMLDGFTNNEYAKNVYLCIAYDEKGKEPVHSVAGASGRDEEVSEHNRILESYRLFIREKPPQPSLQEYDHLIEDTSIWYEDAHVRILQTVPRYIEPSSTFDLRITIEKTIQTPHIEFEYEPDWFGVEAIEELPEGKVKFSEPTDGGQTTYSKTIRLRALPVPPAEKKMQGKVSVKAGTTRLIVGDRLLYELTHVKQSIEISEESSERRMFQAFYERSLDRSLESPSEPCVYLAKINLLQMGATYVIESVERVPFQDYVINPTMLYKILSLQERTSWQPRESASDRSPSVPIVPEIIEFPDIKEEFLAFQEEEEEPEREEQVATGIVEISIVPQEKKKWYQRRQKNFYSEEIEHGLGAGAVLITAGISEERKESEELLADLLNRNNAIYYGSKEVFSNSEYDSDYPKVSIGSVHYPKKGTFRLGVRVHQKTERTRIRVRWWAVKSFGDSVEMENRLEELVMHQREVAVAKK